MVFDIVTDIPNDKIARSSLSQNGIIVSYVENSMFEFEVLS